MKNTLSTIAALVAAAGLSPAASTAVAHFGMGEQELAGTGLGNTPTTLINSLGATNMTIGNGTTAPIVATPSPAPGSTHAMDMNADGTYFSVTDNLVGAHDGFLVEGWAMASTLTGSSPSGINTVFSYGHGGGGILVAQQNNGTWGTFVGGIGWGASTAPVSVGVWTHLAISQANGEATPTFWVNGVAIGPVPENDNTAAGSAIGDQFTNGGHQFDGLVDDVWFSSVDTTFDPATDFQGIPEPTSLALLGLGGLALLRRRR